MMNTIEVVVPDTTIRKAIYGHLTEGLQTFYNVDLMFNEQVHKIYSLG